jgi:hypothetical protein
LFESPGDGAFSCGARSSNSGRGYAGAVRALAVLIVVLSLAPLASGAARDGKVSAEIDISANRERHVALVLVKDRGEPIHTVRFVPTGFRITYLYLTRYCHIVSRGSIACRYANPYPTDEFLVIELTKTKPAAPCTGGRVWVNGEGPYRVAPAQPNFCGK